MNAFDVSDLKYQPIDFVAHCPCCDRYFYHDSPIKGHWCTVCGNDPLKAKEISELLYKEIYKLAQAGDKETLQHIGENVVGMLRFRVTDLLDQMDVT